METPRAAALTTPFPRRRPVPLVAAAPDLKWDGLLLCVAGYILTSVGRVHQLFPVMELLHPAILTGVFAILILLFDPLEQRSSRHLLVPTTKYLVAFLIWMLLSLPWALHVGNSAELVFDNFVKTVLMYLVMAASVRGVRDVERLAFVYLLSATIYSMVVISRFDLGAGDAWRLGRLYYYDANDFATFALTAFPLGFYFVLSARTLFVRLGVSLGLGVLILGFVRSGSRGGFIALVVVIGFMLLRYTGIPLRTRLFSAAIIMFAILGLASDKYWEQMTTIWSDTDYNMTEESGRIQIWKRGVGYMLDNPVFGVGPNNFPVAEGTISPFAHRQQLGFGVRWNAAHNSYIQTGAELGVPGLLLLFAIIVSTFQALRRTGRRAAVLIDEARARLTSALTASLIGFVVGAFFLSLAYSEMLYTLVALAVGLHKVATAPVFAET